MIVYRNVVILISFLVPSVMLKLKHIIILLLLLQECFELFTQVNLFQCTFTYVVLRRVAFSFKYSSRKWK